MPPPPVGDQTVFSSIDVAIRASGIDAVDAGQQVSAGPIVNEARVQVSIEALVEINGGTSAGRVPGLQIFGDGREVVESASAAGVSRFGFPYRPVPAVHGQEVELEFRLGASRFFLAVQPLVVALTTPSDGQSVPSTSPLVLQWTGVATPPSRALVFAREGGCAVFFKQTGPATFVPARDESPGRHEPPCPFQAFAEWRADAPTPPSPFHALRVERAVARLQRFVLVQ